MVDVWFFSEKSLPDVGSGIGYARLCQVLFDFLGAVHVIHYFLSIELVDLIVRALVHDYHFRNIVAFEEVDPVDGLEGRADGGELNHRRLEGIAIDANLQRYARVFL